MTYLYIPACLRMTNTHTFGDHVMELAGFVRLRVQLTTPKVPVTDILRKTCLRCVCFRPLLNARHRHSFCRDVATLRFPIKSSFRLSFPTRSVTTLASACVSDSSCQAIFTSADVVQVNVSAASGDMGILANHVPSIEPLRPGVVEVIESGNPSKKWFGAYCGNLYGSVSESCSLRWFCKRSPW